MEFLVGVDGGGSRCRARVCAASHSRAIAFAEGGAANVYLDFDTGIATIRRVVTEAFAQAGFDPPPTAATSIGLGLAGVSSPAVAARVEAALADFGRVAVTNDGVTACLGAHGGADGGLVIAGTGSLAVLRLDGRTMTFGGRGFHLGDDGSGAQMGRALLRKALRAFDDLEPWSPLLRAVMAAFGEDPVAVIAWARTAPSHAFAAYAPQVFTAADEGDAAARSLVEGSAASIGELIMALHRRGARRIALVGGLAGPLERHLAPEIAALLAPSMSDALTGALLLAGAAPGGSPG